MAHHAVRPASPWLVPLALAAAMTVAGRLDLLAAYALTGDRFQGALLVMLPVGAFLAALPGRLRRHGRPRLRSAWQGCAVCFAGGVLAMLAAGLAEMGDGLSLTGLAQGNVSAWAFAVAAWTAALCVARLKAGWRRHA